MSSILLIVFIVSGAIGLKKQIYGAIAGCILSIILFFLLNSFEIKSFLLTILLGFSVSFLAAYMVPWFFSGYKGGRHSTGPSYMGGGSGRGWGENPGGIIMSDEEKEGIKPSKNIEP